MIIKKTPLYKEHIEQGGTMVEFAGYHLPITYSSIKNEHSVVRQKVGVFDVSHMAEFFISGESATRFLQNITVNDVAKLSIGQVHYSLMCNKNGGIIDDLLLYKKDNGYMMVVNAANHQKDLEWLHKNKDNKNLSIKDISKETGLLALQGPRSRELLKKIVNDDIKSILFYHFKNFNINGIEVLISRTGYTGELGYEIYSNAKDLPVLWKYILKNGEKFGIQPVGLGCRDTLRMEMKYLLYGLDIDSNINPIEAGLGWVTKLEKKEFIGKNALLNIRKNLTRKMVCIKMLERAIPRTGNAIYFNGKVIGEVTSGTMSPSLGHGISMGFVLLKNAEIGVNVFIDIRGNMKKGIIIKAPFYKGGSLLN
ncbi:MAG: glycine cleavage system protein T [Candidatus Marinimicrobia bacterium]|nr:glycine cleavage system protein T [Candidatus Neomarinimicrobiota bacterium]|tara:strand:- start:2308 stop:3405 length:1098 start_codon:yes stop_codon:yes gene_type:complete